MLKKIFFIYQNTAPSTRRLIAVKKTRSAVSLMRNVQNYHHSVFEAFDINALWQTRPQQMKLSPNTASSKTCATTDKTLNKTEKILKTNLQFLPPGVGGELYTAHMRLTSQFWADSKCHRFGHWLTLHTMKDFIYLLTSTFYQFCHQILQLFNTTDKQQQTLVECKLKQVCSIFIIAQCTQSTFTNADLPQAQIKV